MKIKSIRAWEENLGTTRPYTIAFKTVNEVSNAFVEIVLENGVTGLGAGNPSELVVGESFAQCMEALAADNIAFLVGRDIRELNQLTFEVFHKFPRNPSARAALDIALYDAFSSYLGIPLVHYLGKKKDTLPTSITIGIKSVEETMAEAKEYVDRGFFVLKIKLGKDLEEDIERLHKLREKYKSSIILRIDANQGYSLEQTIDFYHRTLALDLELIEQPVPAKAVDALRKLPGSIKEKTAADESLISPHDAWELAQSPKAAGIYNIKLMKCGGISPALKIAQIAEAADIELFWGCNDESIVSISAALHAAFSSTATRYIDLDGSFDLARDIVTGGFRLEKGYLSCLDKPGLGLERIL